MAARRTSRVDPLLSPRALASVNLSPAEPTSTSATTTSSAPPSIHDLPDGCVHACLDLLSPRDLVVAAGTCRRWAALLSDAASDRAWRGFFARRWRTADASLDAGARPPRWRAAYSARLAEAAALAPPSRPTPDSLAGGHRGAARAVALLPSAGVAVTGGADRVVRGWDLGAGLPLAASAPLPWAVRAVAADAGVLAAASGSGRRVALWRRRRDGEGPAPALPWDLSARPTYLAGHAGPVAGVALSEGDGGGGGGAHPSRLFSASWDCSVRVWDVEAATCLAAARLGDWVWAALPRGGRVLCAEGRGAAVLDGETLALVARVAPALSPPAPLAPSAPPGPCARVEGTRDGRSLFVAHADGGVRLYDLRGPTATAAAVLAPPCSPAFPPATSLAFDDPWLALGLGFSGVALLDARQPGAHADTRPRRLGTGAAAGGGDVLGVDLAGPYLAAACASGAVLTWRWAAGAAAAAAAAGRRRRRQQTEPRPPSHRPPSALVADSWEDALMEAGAAAA